MRAIIRDHRILGGMERAGFIIRNGKPGSTERHWTGHRVPILTVEAGPKLDNWYQVFTYKGNEYQIEYFDGCFKPFVTRVGAHKPAFV